MNLSKFTEDATKIERGTHRIDRLSSEEERGRAAGGRRNVEASLIAGREESSGSPEESKVRQIEALTEYAKTEDIWIEDTAAAFGEELDSGSEATVYDNKDETVTKVISPFYYSSDPADFLDRITLHNAIFPNTKYILKGFGINQKGEFSFIVSQKFISVEEHATFQEIKEDLEKRGFNHIKRKDYLNDSYSLEDISPANVLKDPNSNFFYIDTRISLNTLQHSGGNRKLGDGRIIENILGD